MLNYRAAQIGTRIIAASFFLLATSHFSYDDAFRRYALCCQFLSLAERFYIQPLLDISDILPISRVDAYALMGAY